MNRPTVGTLTWHPAESVGLGTWQQRKNTRPVWGLDLLPHVAMRAKRIFARIETSVTSTLYVTDTPEVAREIDWFTQMFPLDADADTRARLAAGVAAHQEMEQAVNDILGAHTGHRVTLNLEPGMTPRDYQTQYVDLIAVVHRLLLGDATGVGKTITGALGFALPDALPALVAMPTNLPPQWTKRMNQLWPMLNVHTLRGTRPYDLRAARENHGHYPDILLAPYSRLAGWREALAGQVRTVLFDEVQNLRTGQSSEKGKAAAHLSARATYVAGLSATPAYGYGPEFWDVLEIIKPGALGSREEFLREWGGAYYGTHATVQDPKAFGTYLRSAGLMLARTRADVGREIPEPVEQVITIDSDSKPLDDAADELTEIATRMLATSTTRADRFLLGGEMSWKLRQRTGLAKAPYVAAHVAQLLDDGEDKVLLVGWHREVYDVWLKALSRFRPVMYTGSETTKAKNDSVEKFLRPSDEGGARVLIMSTASGAGLDDLQKVCSVVVFGELEWSPKVHAQIIARLNRDGQQSTVLAQFLVTEDGSDPKVMEVLGLKAEQTDPVMDPDVSLFEPIPSPTTDQVTSRSHDLAVAWLKRPKTHDTSRSRTR